MGQEILTSLQKRVIKMVADEPNLGGFYLSGGTALATCYLQHRYSDDLDFFSFDDPDSMFLHSFAEKIKSAISADEIRYEKKYDRNLFYFLTGKDELKIEFTKYPFTRLEESELWNGVKVDSKRDVSANKLMALLDRFDPKDFVDLYYLLQDYSLDQIKQDAQNKFGVKIDNLFLGGELAKVKRIEALPKMIKSLVIEDLKNFFTDKAKELNTGVLE